MSARTIITLCPHTPILQKPWRMGVLFFVFIFTLIFCFVKFDCFFGRGDPSPTANRVVLCVDWLFCKICLFFREDDILPYKHHSSFIIHHSSFIIHYSLFIIHYVREEQAPPLQQIGLFCVLINYFVKFVCFFGGSKPPPYGKWGCFVCWLINWYYSLFFGDHNE